MPPDEPVTPDPYLRVTGARKACGLAHAPNCAICGLSLPMALDVAHLDQRAGNNAPDNLAFLCKTHHKLVDVGFYPVEIVKFLRDRWTQMQRGEWKPDNKLYMKNAGADAALTRARRQAARKAVETRRARTAALPSTSPPLTES